MSYGLGIDVGTIFTAAAVVRTGSHGPDTPQILPLGSRSASIPTVVFLGQDGTRLVGEAAERRGLSHPECVAREFKRRMGDDVPLIVGGTEVLPEDLFAAVVTWVVEVATEREGELPDVVTLTHPASWGGHRTSRLTQALTAAGIGDVVLMTEPEAAALSYASREHVACGSTLAVYDLGGGTFDATVVRKTDADTFSVLGVPQGLERLGGADFDQEIFHRVLDSAKIPSSELDPADPDVVAALNRLRRECAEAKEALSSDSEATVSVMIPGTHSSVRLVRSEFETMIEPALAETVDTLHSALESAQVGVEDLTAILLVGGSSRIPLVAQLLSGEFDRPLAIDLDPKASVALGAAFATAALEDAPDQEAVPAAGTAAGTATPGGSHELDEPTRGTNAAGFGLPSRAPAVVPRHGPPAMASNRRLGLRVGAIAAAVALLGVATASATGSPNPLAALSALASDQRAEAAEEPVPGPSTEGATPPAGGNGSEGILGPVVAPDDTSNFLERTGIRETEPTAAKKAKSAEATASRSPDSTSRTTNKTTEAAEREAATSQESPDGAAVPGDGPTPAPSPSAAHSPGTTQKPGTSPVDPTPPVPFPSASPTPTPVPDVPTSAPAPQPTLEPTPEPIPTPVPTTEPPVEEPPVLEPTVPPATDPSAGATTSPSPSSPDPQPSSTESAPGPTAPPEELPPPEPTLAGEGSTSYAPPEA